MKIFGREKHKKNRIIRMFSVAAAAVMIFAMTIPVAAAERTYRVSFKSGSGTYSDNSTSQNLDVANGTNISGNLGTVESQITPPDGYYFTGWSPDVETTVSKRANYVAQYARIVDEAIYKVNYLNEQGTAVATAKTTRTQLGAAANETAPAIEGYNTPAAQTVTIDQATGMEITFTYTSSAETTTNTVTNTETVTVPGGTTTNTVTVPNASTTTTNNGTTNTAGTTNTGTTGTNNGTAGTAAGTDTAGTNNTGEVDTAEGTDNAGAADNTAGTDDAQNGGTVVNPDEDVPLAGGNDEDTDEDTVKAPDTDVPLAKQANYTWIYIVGVIAVLAAAGVLVGVKIRAGRK